MEQLVERGGHRTAAMTNTAAVGKDPCADSEEEEGGGGADSCSSKRRGNSGRWWSWSDDEAVSCDKYVYQYMKRRSGNESGRMTTAFSAG